jgi:Family of unknown function (DUF5413)
MKRYVVFILLGPMLGGLLLLLTGAYLSGFLHGAPVEFGKVLVVWVTTLHYLFLFGFLPSGIVAAIDDVLCHVKRLNPVGRMLIVGLVGFAAAELLYGGRGGDAGPTQFVLYGLVGLIPAMICSWLSHLWIARNT